MVLLFLDYLMWYIVFVCSLKRFIWKLQFFFICSTTSFNQTHDQIEFIHLDISQKELLHVWYWENLLFLLKYVLNYVSLLKRFIIGMLWDVASVEYRIFSSGVEMCFNWRVCTVVIGKNYDFCNELKSTPWCTSSSLH